MKSHIQKTVVFIFLLLPTLIVKATPTISLIGAATIKHQVNTPYIDSGATAKDVNGNDISHLVTHVTGKVFEFALGTYKITYAVIDSNGNKASVTRTVMVVDCIPPVLISPAHSDTITVCLNDFNFREPVVTAIDNYYPSVQITRSGFYDLTKVGTYIIVYTGTDGAGNTATYSRVIIVEDCSNPPLYLEENSFTDKISIFPNPTTRFIKVTINNQEKYTAILSDNTGKAILFKEISNSNNSLNVENLKHGIYYLTIKGLNSSSTKKVIITQ
jgi:hypothetical protein